jgi:hypothetical protein
MPVMPAQNGFHVSREDRGPLWVLERCRAASAMQRVVFFRALRELHGFFSLVGLAFLVIPVLPGTTATAAGF